MMWRILWPLLISAALALISANFLLGLPGALFLDAVLTSDQARQIGEGRLAFAAAVSMGPPFGIALAIWASMIWRPQARCWQVTLASIAAYLTTGYLIAWSVARSLASAV
jgi:hypothetical protein